jgi:5-methylcytosine-specific restriction endonuclease McrA
MNIENLDECLEALLAHHGYSEFWYKIKRMSRRRLQVQDRPKRIHLSPRKRERLYFKHGGLCHNCQTLIDPKSKWEVDHVNPNLEGDEFNAESNLAPSCSACNREKSAQSVQEFSKSTGRTFEQILK